LVQHLLKRSSGLKRRYVLIDLFHRFVLIIDISRFVISKVNWRR